MLKPTALALIAILAFAAPVDRGAAQQLYKYRGPDGVWVYTDRQPNGGDSYETLPLQTARERAEVRLYRRTMADGGLQLVAQNTYFGPVQIAYRLSSMDNLAAGAPSSGIELLPPRSETRLLELHRENPAVQMSLEYQFQYIPGDPESQHTPSRPYRLPYALASSYPVSQAFPETITHNDPSSQHAIDFVMPVGTGVYAARAGTVLEVASDYFEAGLDPAADGPRANIVRVLHDDGTMSLYGHLNWNSIRVVPGQRIARGEYLADSGNTGFSSGPHLHFVVQRNRGGAIVSVPVRFRGSGNEVITVARGDRPVAY